MNPTNTNLPDNLKSRLSRVYVDAREFNDPDTGKLIKYDRLVLEVQVKGESFPIEFKPEKKDLAILKFADVIDAPTASTF